MKLNHDLEQAVLNTMIKSLKKDSELLPPFIDNKNTSHKVMMELSGSVVLLFIPLFSMKVLTKNNITSITNQISDLMVEMLSIDGELTLLFYDWWIKCLDAYRKLCMVNELFETIQNIDNFKTTLG